MVRPIGSQSTTVTTNATSITCALPPHKAGDLLVACVSTDTSGSLSTTSTGWTKHAEAGTSQANSAIFYNRATGSSEADLVASITSSGEITAVVVNLDDTHATSTFNAINTPSNQATTSIDTDTITPTEANTYILEIAVVRAGNVTQGIFFEPDITQIASAGVGFRPNIAVAGYTHTPSSSATTSHKVLIPTTSNLNNHHWVIAIRDDGSGNFTGDQDPGNAPATLIHSMSGTGYSGYLGTSTTADPTGLINTLEGTATVYDALSGSNLLTNVNHQPNNHCSLTLFSSNQDDPNIARFGLASAQDLSDATLSFLFKTANGSVPPYATGGVYLGLITGTTTGAEVWKVAAKDTAVSPPLGLFPYVISTLQDEHENFGTPNNASVSDIMVGCWMEGSQDTMTFAWLYDLQTMTMINGSTNYPCNFDDCARTASSAGLFSVQAQGGQAVGQFYVNQDIQIGNGSDTTLWDSNNQSVEYPAAYDEAALFVHCNVPQSHFTLSVYAGANDDIKLRNTTLNMGDLHNFLINASTSTSATYDLSGLVVLNATPTLNDVGTALSGISFSGCSEITKNACDLSGGCTISNSVSTYAVTVSSEAEFNDLQNCDFLNNNYSIRITGNHGGDTWSGTGMTVSGGTGSYDIRYEGTGTLTIEMDVGSGFTQPRAEATTGTLTISTPTISLTVNSSEASSDIKIFDTGTQTIEASATGTTANTTSAGTYDITVMKAGFLPQRQTGVVLGTSNVTVDITLVPDPVYNASHGLTFTTDYSYNRSTRVMTIVAAQQGRDLYSALIDDFISESSLDNSPFPLAAVGIDRIDFTSDGTTAATIDSGDVQFWRGAGMEWEHATTGNPTHKYCSIVGTGTNAAGTKGFYQQVDGASPTSMTLVSNNVDQVIQYFSDPNGDGSTADGYDYSDHLVIKLFNDGYYQIASDVIQAYGLSAIESFEYVLPLAMTSTGLGTGDRSITITVTDNTPAGVEEQSGYTFDYKIEGGASDSPEDLLRQWIYDVYTDPTASDYASKVNFNWPDPIVESGGNYETQYGYVYGQDTTTTFHGFYVEEGSDYHPDFLRQQSNDGSYFVTPVPTPTFTVNSSESGSDIKIFNTGTQTIEAQATGTTASTTTAATYDITVMKAGFLPQRQTGIVFGTSSVTVDITLIADPVYDSSHGLTFTTDYSYNATTRVMTIVAAQQGRDLYSALIDDFISQSALDNRPFPLSAVGIDRIDFTSDGTTAATIDSGDVQFWRGAGMEWEHATTGNPTHKYCSVKGSSTNAAGTKGFYQQVDGASPTAITTLVNNNIDQVIQYFSDPNGDGSTADGYDYSDHLVVKLFNDGYYQISSNILTAYGVSAIESFEYIVPLTMTSTGLGTGDRGITITVTDNTPAGVEEQSGYTFDYKIEGGAADSPEDLLRQWIYDVYTDPTASDYASKVNFNWPDPIVESGGNYETQYGYVYGQDTTTTFHGFYVEEGSDYHPDFLRQQANDGSYFVTPVLANISVTGLPTDGSDIRLQITNESGRSGTAWSAAQSVSAGDYYVRSTGAGSENNDTGLFFVAGGAGTTGGTEPTWDTTPGNTTTDNDITWTCRAVQYYSGDPGASAYSSSYTDGEEFAAGDTYRIRFAEHNGTTSFKTATSTGVAASSGFTVAASIQADSVFAANAVDGSLVTMFTADYTNDELDLSADTDFTGAQMYAYFSYQLTTGDGIEQFWGGIDAIDSGNYKIVTGTLSLYFDNTTTGSVKQTDDARIYRDDDVYPVKDPTTSAYGVQINWAKQVFLAETGVSGLTGSESAQLLALGTPAQNASAVLTAAQTTAIESNIKYVNDVEVTGTGAEGSEWGPA